ALQGKAAEGITAVEEGLALAQGDHRFVLTARIYLARIRLAADPTQAVGEIEEGSPFIHLAHAEALLASGDTGAARLAAAGGRTKLLAQAEKIADAALRRS